QPAKARPDGLTRVRSPGTDRASRGALSPSGVMSVRGEMPLEDLQNLRGRRGHLVNEVAAVVVEAFGAKEARTGMPLHHRHPRFEPIGEDRPAARFHQADAGKLIPG